MAALIGEIDRGAAARNGSLVTSLNELASHGVPVLPTVVCDSDSLAEIFFHGKDATLGLLNELCALISTRLTSSTDICIRYSSQHDLVGLPECVRAHPTLADVHNAIQRLARSWRSDKTQAFLLSNQLRRDEALPALVFQQWVEPLWSAVSRDAASGGRTTPETFRLNIHNTAPTTDARIFEVLYGAEGILRRPVKLCFTLGQEVIIASAVPQLIREDALFAAYVDLANNGVISDEAFLQVVEPWMFYQFLGWQLTGTDLTKSKGIGAVPGRIVGRLWLRGHEFTGDLKRVFTCRESSPGDISELRAADAAIAAFGGSSSHLALQCRVLHIPCVVGLGFDVDWQKGTIRLPTGAVMEEGAQVFVDGFAGEIAFSESGDFSFARHIGPKKAAEAGLTALLARLARFDDLTLFRSLPLDLQSRIGSLNRALVELGLKKW